MRVDVERWPALGRAQAGAASGRRGQAGYPAGGRNVPEST